MAMITYLPRVLRPLMWLGATIFVACWTALASIQSAAFSQPTSAQGDFRYPQEIKGTLRYLSQEQAEWYSIADSAILAGWLIAFVSGASEIWLKRRAKKSNASNDGAHEI